MPISRFDFTQDARDLLNFAVSMRIIDAIELAVLVSEHGANTNAIREEITGAAATFIHTNRNVHAAWCTANDAFGAGHDAFRQLTRQLLESAKVSA